MTEKVKIFGKAGWPHTERARSAFRDDAVYYDVKVDSSKLDEMLKYSKGIRKVPTIVQGEKVTIGFEGGAWGV